MYIGEIMAYQRCIIWAASNFGGTAWVTYDSCYRCWAATKISLNRSVEDTALSQEALAGQARAISQCSFCLSRLYASYVGNPDPDMQADCLKVIKMAVLALTSKSPAMSMASLRTASAATVRLSNETCCKWNRHSRTYLWCRYNHVRNEGQKDKGDQTIEARHGRPDRNVNSSDTGSIGSN